MWQSIHDTNMCCIDTCTIVIDIFLYWQDWSLGRWHTLFGTTKKVFCITIRAHATPCHFLIWMGTVVQLLHADYHNVLMLKYDFYQWMRQRIHITLIVVDRYLQLMGDKMIPDSAEPHLELFYPPFIEDIDLAHQGVLASYNLQWSHNTWSRVSPALL